METGAAVSAAAAPRAAGIGGLWRLATSRPALSIADQGVVSLANLATVLMLTRFCSKAEYGLYALAFTLVIAFTIAQQSLVAEAYKVFRPRLSEAERRRYTGSVFVHALLFAAAACAGLYAASRGMAAPAGAEADLRPVLAMLAAVMGFVLLKEFGRQLCFAALRPGAALAIDCAVSVLQVGGIAVLLYAGRLSSATALLALGAGSAAAGLAWLAASAGGIRPQGGAIASDFVRNWRFSKWIVAYALLFALSVQGYPWILHRYHGVEGAAVYGACFMVVNILTNPLVNGLGSFLGPKMAHALHETGVEAVGDLTRKATWFFLALLGLFSAALLFLGNALLLLLSGEQYAGHGAVAALLAFAQTAWAATVPPNAALLALERPDVMFRAVLIALAVTGTAGAALTAAWGPLGAASGLLAANAAALAYTQAAYRGACARARQRSTA